MSLIAEVLKKIYTEEGADIYSDPDRFYALAEDYFCGREPEFLELLRDSISASALQLMAGAHQEAKGGSGQRRKALESVSAKFLASGQRSPEEAAAFLNEFCAAFGWEEAAAPAKNNSHKSRTREPAKAGKTADTAKKNKTADSESDEPDDRALEDSFERLLEELDNEKNTRSGKASGTKQDPRPVKDSQPKQDTRAVKDTQTKQDTRQAKDSQPKQDTSPAKDSQPKQDPRPVKNTKKKRKRRRGKKKKSGCCLWIILKWLLFILILYVAYQVVTGYMAGRPVGQTLTGLINEILPDGCELPAFLTGESSQEEAGSSGNDLSGMEEAGTGTAENTASDEGASGVDLAENTASGEGVSGADSAENTASGEGVSGADSAENAASGGDVSVTEAVLLSAAPDLSAYMQVTVTSAGASSTISQSGVNNEAMVMFDGLDESSWQEGVDGYGIGETVECTFDQTYQVKYLSFKLGNWRSNDYFVQNSTPAALKLTLGSFSSEISFTYMSDAPFEQWVELTAPVEASSLQLAIAGVWPGTVYEDTCIAEITLWGIQGQ